VLALAGCPGANTPATLDSISVIPPTDTVYAINAPFDAAGLVVTADYSDGTKPTFTSGYTLAWNGAPLEDGNTAITAAAGDKTVTVIYKGKTADFAITVTDDDPLGTLAGLTDYLNSLPANTAAPPHTVVLDSTVTINTANTNLNGVWATINRKVQAAGKYVILDLSACTAVHGAAANTIQGNYSFPTNNNFNVINSNIYIKSVTLPSTLTTIGNYAFFYCRDLTGSLTIPDSVTTIGDSAFSSCSGLTGPLTIPDSVTTIGDSAFRGCNGLTGSLTIPDSVTTIGNNAFSNCSGLTGSLTIGNSVTTIGDSAFSNCSGLTGPLVIPDSVTTIRSQDIV
jgi:hypothetical protein